MRNENANSLMRRRLCAALLCATNLGFAGCSGTSLFSAKQSAASREEELVKSLNEERKRAQYFESQYEQALARVDQTDRGNARQIAKGPVSSERSDSKAFTAPKASSQFVSAEKSSPKVLNRLASSLPGLRLGPDKTWAKLDADLLFGGGSKELSPGASDLIADLAKTLSQDSTSDVRVLVVGYSDTQRDDDAEGANGAAGEDATWQIAAQRAVEVVRELGQHGIAAERLSAMSRGAQDPVAGNDTAAARAQNRRVEIYLLEQNSTWAPDWTARLR